MKPVNFFCGLFLCLAGKPYNAPNMRLKPHLAGAQPFLSTTVPVI